MVDSGDPAPHPMLRVLQHYLPIRTALLFLGELVLFSVVVGVGMSQHLWELVAGRSGPGSVDVMGHLARAGLLPEEALLRCLVSALSVAVLSQVAIAFHRLYEFRISNSRYQRAARFVEAAGVALGLNVALLLVAHVWGLSRVLDFPGLSLSQRLQHLVASLITAFAAAYLFRIAYHAVMRRVNLNQRVLVLGSRGPAHSLARQVVQHPEAGYEVVGLVPESEPEGPRRGGTLLPDPDHSALPVTRAMELTGVDLLTRPRENRGVAMSRRGGADELLDLSRELRADLVVVALEDRRSMLPTQELLACRLAGLEVREREEVFEEITGRIAVSAMRPSYLIFNEGFRRHPWADLAKRLLDLSAALVIFLIFWPVMLVTAALVKATSPGPALFTQERVGLNGKLFTLYKFRSMRNDAEKASGPVWSSQDDPRITPVGRFIRKTRLDELPQLFNVIRGSMSLVGPRPEREHFVDSLAERIPYFHQRHIVKPGLTGWAQINYPYGNTEEDALAKLQYDLFYIKNHSLLFDLSILITTIRTVVLRQGT